ncbi:hypothetical protein DENIS_4476 [Desulfonema ishimotonii]|uniref:Uncharacterized protein n=1 Tax=Desulfonema ishimotonii TaxID=45657 RepID=A0A401G2K4_9BACT|nr:hypothetical protein [Desulfonema ishimotonii]GBC63482.1 hypothetical protein DENIS_4476 [Desulfonema ishimotonii]
MIIVGLISAANHSYALGGPRKLINLLARSHKITVEEYIRAGLKYCTVKGRFRWADGRIEEVEWPVVGLEGQKLVYWSGERLVRDGKHGKFTALKPLPPLAGADAGKAGAGLSLHALQGLIHR